MKKFVTYKKLPKSVSIWGVFCFHSLLSVRLSDRIIFAFIVIPFAGTDVAAGFAGLVFQRAIAAAGILSGGK